MMITTIQRRNRLLTAAWLLVFCISFASVTAASSTASSTFNCANVGEQQQINAINGCACFQNGDELRNAASNFISDGCSDSNNCNNSVVQQYGWPIGTWCVSNVTEMDQLFSPKYYFNDDISGWDVSSVTTMNRMFYYASSFNQDLSTWNVSSVTDMSWMFRSAASFNQDLSSWNVSSVTTMNRMFGLASSFNQDLSSWDVSSVIYMNEMFYNASSFNQDLSAWNVSSVTDMNGMFNGASSFNQDLCSWGEQLSLPSRYGYSDLFAGSGCNYQENPIWEQGGPFCASFCAKKCFSNPAELKLAVDTIAQDDCPTSIMQNSNPGCNSTTLEEKKKEIQGTYGFSISTWCVSNVTDMSYLFANMVSFNEDISQWDVSAVTNMEGMFQGASSFDQDLSSWDVSAVTNGDGMFEGAEAFDASIICQWGEGWRQLVRCVETTPPNPPPATDLPNETPQPSPVPQSVSATAKMSWVHGAIVAAILLIIFISVALPDSAYLLVCQVE